MSSTSLASVFGISGVLELIGGALLIIGLWTKPVAFVLSGMAAIAYFYIHFPKNFYPLLNGGEAAILFCFLLLYLSGAGGGPWSADEWFGLTDRESATDRDPSANVIRAG
jgi:putative oxidoreductase